MKKLLVLGLLAVGAAGCNDSAADPDPAHTAIIEYLKKNLNDPASYEPVRWDKPTGYARRDSASAAAKILSAQYDRTKTVSLIKQAIALEAITDTTRLGMRIAHAYRAKNKLGATVLDSAQFVVYKNGEVQRL